MERIKVARELKLHLVNKEDMREYAWTQLKDNRLTSDEHNILVSDGDHRTWKTRGGIDWVPISVHGYFLWKIVRLLLSKAEGVFLWLVLSVRSVLRGLRNKDSQEEILLRVEQLPADLQSLYQGMWNRMNIDEPIYRESAAIMLSFMIELHKIGDSAQLLEFGFLLNLKPPLEVLENGIDPDQLPELLRRAERLVNVQSAGLLEINPDISPEEPIRIIEYGAASPYSQFKDFNSGANERYIKRQVSFIYRTAYDYLTNTKHGRTVITCKNLPPGSMYRDFAQCRLAAARCFSWSSKEARRWPDLEQIHQDAWIRFIAMAIAMGDDAVVQTSTNFLDVCSTLFDANNKCAPTVIHNIAPLASYLLSYPSLLSYVLHRHQPDSITRVLQLNLILSYYDLHDTDLPFESFNQCVEFGAKIEPRMSFPSMKYTDLKETILETLALKLLSRDHDSLNSRLRNSKSDRKGREAWVRMITRIAECILALQPTVQDLRQTLPLWRTILEHRKKSDRVLDAPRQEHMYRYTGCEKIFEMSERPSPHFHITKHQDSEYSFRLDIAFEANVSRLLTEPLMILARCGYPIENIEPLARLSKLADSVAPSVKVFYVLETATKLHYKKITIDNREVAYYCNFDTEGNDLMCTELNINKIKEFLVDNARLYNMQVVVGKLGMVGSNSQTEDST